MDSGTLPRPTGAGLGFHERITAFRRQIIEEALRAHGGNRTHAATALGVQRTYLQRLIREFGITVPIPARWRQHTNGEE